MAIGWGGHTDNGNARPAQFSVVMSDGRSCMDHKAGVQKVIEIFHKRVDPFHERFYMT